MAQDDLTTYLAKLDEVLPADERRKQLREQLTIGDQLCCWMCATPKSADQYTGDSIICNHCVPTLVRKVEATQLALSGGGYKAQLRKLQQSSQPEFINQVDGLLDRMRNDNTNLAVMAYEKAQAIDGVGLSPEEMKTHVPDHRTSGRIILELLKSIGERDKHLSTENKFGDIDSDELIGVAVETVIEQMALDKDFCQHVADAIHTRIPGFAQMLIRPAEVVGAAS